MARHQLIGRQLQLPEPIGYKLDGIAQFQPVATIYFADERAERLAGASEHKRCLPALTERKNRHARRTY